MSKRYILMTMKNDDKYDGFIRYSYKLFENYYDLQRHLKDFWYIRKPNYVIFEETETKRDYSLNDIKGAYYDN